MKEKLLEIKKIIDELLSEIKEPVEEKAELQQLNIDHKEFDILKQLLDSSAWPEAVFHSQIADENSENDKEERAEGICDIMLPPLSNKKFLDFGCGEGHVTKCISKQNNFSVGYDIARKPNTRFEWENLSDDFLLTNDFEKVKENGPYDAILLYDVIDHSRETEDALLKVKSVLSESGQVFVRCHPWSSRHGGHAYKKINKAFAHLVFTEEELKFLGFELEFNKKITFPIKTYRELFENAGFTIENQEVDTQEVEQFFEDNPLVRQRILNSFGLQEWTLESPTFQLSQCFVDFVLKQ